jgi:hypothetical protein
MHKWAETRKGPIHLPRMRKFARSSIFFRLRQHAKTFGENFERKKVNFNPMYIFCILSMAPL